MFKEWITLSKIGCRRMSWCKLFFDYHFFLIFYVWRDCPLNYCDEENGIFWGEVTDKEREFVAKLSERWAQKQESVSRVFEKSSEKKNLLDQTMEEMKFQSKPLFDKSIEVKAQDLLLSPFPKSSAKVGQEVAITRSLVPLDTTLMRPLGESTPRIRPTPKSKIAKFVGIPTPVHSRLMSRDSSINDSTLDFILNEIKCNSSKDSEEFLTNDKQLV